MCRYIARADISVNIGHFFDNYYRPIKCFWYSQFICALHILITLASAVWVVNKSDLAQYVNIF